METKTSHITIGAAVLAMVALGIAFTIWLAGLSGGAHKQYDIFFKQSVDGIANGTAVTFSGVPAGKVSEIGLWKPNPQLVRVRILVNEDVPILEGTTATISSLGFTGQPQVQLFGAIKGAPEITALGPAGIPTIPTKATGLNEALNNTPQLVERLTTLTERLATLVSDKNQASITGILANTHELSKSLRDQGPEMRATLQQTRQTIKLAGDAVDQIAKLSNTTNGLVNDQGKNLLVDLRKSINEANKSFSAVNAVLQDARPGLQTISTQTVPEATQLVRDLRVMSESLTTVANRLDQAGGSSLLGQPKLPDYRPERH